MRALHILFYMSNRVYLPGGDLRHKSVHTFPLWNQILPWRKKLP